jgi:hypothetical protein
VLAIGSVVLETLEAGPVEIARQKALDAPGQKLGREWILRWNRPEHRTKKFLNHRIGKWKSSVRPDPKPGSQLLHQPALHALALNDDDLLLHRRQRRS